MIASLVIVNSLREPLEYFNHSHEHTMFCENFDFDRPSIDHEHHWCVVELGLIPNPQIRGFTINASSIKFNELEFEILSKKNSKFDRFKFNPKDPPLFV